MRKRVDVLQAGIVKALRDAGATVQDLHEVGRGCPDLLCGYRGLNFLLEVKSRNGRTTPREFSFVEAWQGRVFIVHSVREATQALGIGIGE